MPQYTPPFSPTIEYSQTGTAYTVYVGGVEAFALAGSLQIEQSVGRKSQASFVAYADYTVLFKQFQQVAILDGSGALIFSGYLTTPKASPPGVDYRIWSLSCIGQDFLAKKRVYTASHVNRTCGYIAKDIFDTILQPEGAIIGQIFDGLTPSEYLYPSETLYPGGVDTLIPQADFSYVKVADALDALAKEASASGVPYYWMIDQDKKLWFVPYTAVTGPAIDGTQIDQDRNPPTITFANPKYRNTQYVTGGVAQTVTQNESRQGDGKTVSWPMGFALASTPTINVNSVSKTVGIRGVSTGKDFYWSKGEKEISQDSGATKLTSSDTLNVSYVGQFPNTAISANAAQITYQASIDGTTGIIEEVEGDSTLATASNALSVAANNLTRFAQQGAQLQFTTQQSGFAPGQLCAINEESLGLINTSVLIETITITDGIDGLNIYYQITATIGPYDTHWTDFFSKLLEKPKTANAINVGASESTSILVSLGNTITPINNLNIDVYACPLPSESLFPSETLFPC